MVLVAPDEKLTAERACNELATHRCLPTITTGTFVVALFGGVHKVLNLRVLAHTNDRLEVKWALGGDPCRDNATPLQGTSPATTHAFKFRALLTGLDAQLELTRV